MIKCLSTITYFRLGTGHHRVRVLPEMFEKYFFKAKFCLFYTNLMMSSNFKISKNWLKKRCILDFSSQHFHFGTGHHRVWVLPEMLEKYFFQTKFPLFYTNLNMSSNFEISRNWLKKRGIFDFASQ